MKALKKIYYLIRFLLYYLQEVILSNISIAADILTPKHRMSPAIVDVKLYAKNENEILAIANLVSMTPGTLALDYDQERNVLKVHAMYFDDPEKFRKSMEKLQMRIHKIFS